MISKEMRLAFIIGYGGGPIPLLSKILSEESREHGFEYLVANDEACLGKVDFINEADAIFIYSHTLPKEVEDAIKGGRARLILSLSDAYAHLTKSDAETFFKASAYFKTGGERNLRGLVHLILKKLGHDVEVPELEEIPWHGIFHPEIGLFRALKDYLKAYPYASRDMVGLLFYRSTMLYGQQQQLVKAMIDALEEEGMGVVPVFTYGFRDALLNTPTSEDSIREFFFVDDEPVIDALIDLTFFFLLDHGNWSQDSSQRSKVVRGVDLLKKLNVPIISAVTSFYQSIPEWLRDPKGVDYLTQVYKVIMPEVDGLIEPIVVAGAKNYPDGTKRYEPYEEHAKYIAKRVRKWIELRRKSPSERKIAIVLINPPCKNLEASVAVGYELDVPESVVRLLHRLKELGYWVGDNIPRDGKELVKLILERRAISEFRWTSVEEIVKRGGAVAFVDADEYMQYFEELPPEVKKKVIQDWGDPIDVLKGRASKELVGMVYDGKFVVPGLLFGNVFITVQPKFGCAGPACDGKVCRILHDPTITPPHQWLAVYRWISRSFKADVLIHFGTHGYLEFRPGKGVGLSPSCWPEISVDDVPHLYVYVVSNPMEGVIAKRRGYATIVDHAYPPMAMAEVLEEIDSLLTQYSRAKQLEELARAEAIYDELVQKAKRANVPIRGKTPDEVVENIHIYVSGIRGTQIDMGLHVFGHPVEDPAKLAEYVATAMAYDSHNFPSIRRALADYLGLDYDWMRNEPLAINDLGLTNSETIELLHKLAVGVIRRLLEMKVAQAQLTPDLLSSLVRDELQSIGLNMDNKIRCCE